MTKRADRIVYKQDEAWINKRLSASKASSKHPTQKEAEHAADRKSVV